LTENSNVPSLVDAIISSWQPKTPELSSGGMWIAWSASPYGMEGENPVSAIWVARSDGTGEARQFTSGTSNDTLPRWSPDGRTIAFLSDRSERGIAGLYLLSIDGGEAIELVQRRAEIQTFAWSPDGKSIAFTCPDDPSEEDERRTSERDDANVYGENLRNGRLHIVDVDSGQVRVLPTGELHTREVVFSPDGSQIACFTQPDPGLEPDGDVALTVLSLSDDSVREICKTRREMVGNLIWAADGKWLCYLGFIDDRISSMGVHAAEAGGGTPRIIGPDQSSPVCASSIRLVPGEKRLMMAVADGLSTRLEWLDPETGSTEPFFQPTEGDISPEFSVALDTQGNARMSVIASTGSRPPEVHTGSPARLDRVSNHHQLLDHYTFGEQEPFFWTSSDGLELDGILIRPVDAGEGPWPTIVQIHGGPYGRYTAGWNLRPGHWAQWMAAHGYAVLMPNYRGGQGHGDVFAKWADSGVGDMEFFDIMSAVDAAIERGLADPNRLGIGGWSQGGFLTAWGVTQTDRFRAGVMGAGVSDWGMMVMTSDLPRFESLLGGGRPWDGPGPHRYMQHSPISYAKNVTTPLLILHGEQDARVPVSQAIGFHRALRENDVETQMVTYPREPHGLREANHQRDAFCRVRDWYLAHV
jgi:dipeptidyl aminopeptidase/acylaminoacyl peptidase